MRKQDTLNKVKLIITCNGKRSNVCIQKRTNDRYEFIHADSLDDDEVARIIRVLNNTAEDLCRTEATKVCPKCGRTFPLSAFYAKRSGRNNTAHLCKECYIQESLIRSKTTPEEIQKIKRQNRYLKKCNTQFKNTLKKLTLMVAQSQREEPVVQEEKYCTDCARHDYCFPETYENESNFANTCKRYKHK